MKLFFCNYHKLERDIHIDQQFRATPKLDHRAITSPTFPLASCHVAFLYAPLVSPASVPQQIKRSGLQARDWAQAFQKRHLEGSRSRHAPSLQAVVSLFFLDLCLVDIIKSSWA
jgi:hypothetical protein